MTNERRYRICRINRQDEWRSPRGWLSASAKRWLASDQEAKIGEFSFEDASRYCREWNKKYSEAGSDMQAQRELVQETATQGGDVLQQVRRQNDGYRSIMAALEDLNEFKAVVLILDQRGEKDPRFAAWSLGPIKGQALISDWLAATGNESKI